MTIFVEEDRILVVPPAGAAAVLPATQVHRLCAVLDQAVRRSTERWVS
ncbi:MAG: hypothetical protein ACJ72N_17525 [Labedaea sp.]